MPPNPQMQPNQHQHEGARSSVHRGRGPTTPRGALAPGVSRSPDLTRPPPVSGVNSPRRRRGGANTQDDDNSPPGRPRLARGSRLTFASLNLQGLRRGGREKLPKLVAMARGASWGVVALQETHESLEASAALERTNQRWWAFPNAGTANCGGTILLVDSKRFPTIKSKNEIRHKVLIPGCAQLIQFKWDSDDELAIVNIYAPPQNAYATTFFEELEQKLVGTSVKMVLGDFNHVTMSIDRFPPRPHRQSMAVDALNGVMERHRLHDGWRLENEGSHMFTWTANKTNSDGTISRSRLDRILVKHEILQRSNHWDTVSSGDLSDHEVVTVEIRAKHAPAMGQSRWRMNDEDLTDVQNVKALTEVLRKCQKDMGTFGKDAMEVWLDAKETIKNTCIENAKVRNNKHRRTEAYYEKLKAQTQRRRDFNSNSGLQTTLLGADRKLKELKAKEMKAKQSFMTARYGVQGEAVNKYWLSLNKAARDESVIHALKDAEGRTQTETSEMTRIANAYHRALQMDHPLTPERQRAVDKVLDVIDGTSIKPEESERMAAPISKLDTIRAIKAASTGKSPGLDGITYEFYKLFLELKGEDEEDDFPRIEWILTRIFNYVEQKKKAPARYTRGGMFLMHKKKEKDKVENYRPITLLNTDYKLQTKVYATRLGENVTSVIHPDQVGFVPGRSILDHIKLAEVVMDYCELYEKSGSIIALDQEKAYDKIDHKYLWKVLKSYGLPDSFIDTIKALYENATTTVIVNKTAPEPFPVQRGVRQGDPLSCLLFNLAIEPLAESLRKSDLKGITIPGAAERIVCKLFADDTLVYLHKKDKWSKLNGILNTWCLAAGAKFNTEKTEVLPIGPQRHREGVLEERSLRGQPRANNEPLPEGVRIVADGEAMRVLGGFIGHKVDQEAVWAPIIQKMEARASNWSRTNMTVKGRKIILSSLIMSQAHYVMMTNDPPKAVIKKVQKVIHGFMWKGRRAGNMKMEELYKPRDKGGMNLPSFEWRQITGHLAWAQRWCAPDISRPIWTDILNENLRKILSKSSNKRAHEANQPGVAHMVNQDWRIPKVRASGIRPGTSNMIKTALNFGIQVDAPKISADTKLQAPAWMSSHATIPTDLKKETSSRLRRYHNVTMIRDLEGLEARREACFNHDECLQEGRKLLDRLKPKWNPELTTPWLRRNAPPDDLDHTPRRLEANLRAWREGENILLNPDMTHKGDIMEATRIFVSEDDEVIAPAVRAPLPPTNERVEIWTDGSADKNGQVDSNCGAGIWCKDRPEFCKSYKVIGAPPTNNRGEIAAVTYALWLCPMNVELQLYSDSTYVINGLVSTHKRWEDIGWLGVENHDLWKSALGQLRARGAKTFIQKVKAHSRIHGNEMADQMAKDGLTLPQYSALPPRAADRWQHRGARLSALTFHDIYKWVAHLKSPGDTTKAREILRTVAHTLRDKFQYYPPNEMIWTKTWDRLIRREVSAFLWMALHGRTRTGVMICHWPGFEDKRYCECGAEETLEHILMGCEARLWVEDIWREARHLLEKAECTKAYREEKAAARQMLLQIGEVDTEPVFPVPSYHELLGVGCWQYSDKAMNRLMKTVMSETAFVIWKCQNILRVREEPMNSQKAKGHFHYHLRHRAELDWDAVRVTRGLSEKSAKEYELQKEVWLGVMKWDPIRETRAWLVGDHG